MSTFQGFDVTGIDRNKYPVFTDDQILYNEIYLILKPIGDCANVENQKVWGHSFCWMVQNWGSLEEFNRYQHGEIEIPRLKFVLQRNDEFFIRAYGPPLADLVGSVSFIQRLVECTNQRCIRSIEEIEHHRQYIDQHSSMHFKN